MQYFRTPQKSGNFPLGDVVSPWENPVLDRGCLGQQACPREEGGQFFVVSLCYVDETTGLLYVQRYVMG